MTEILIEQIGKEDIKAPALEPGETSIVLQRHERYQRDRNTADSGSLFEADAAAAKDRDRRFFDEVLKEDADQSPTYFMFASSDTQYNEMGYRSMETAQLAEDACQEAMLSLGLDPKERIINLNQDFTTKAFKNTGQEVRHLRKLREPDIFNTPDYVSYLREKYGDEDGPGTGMSKAAWAAHEADAEKKKREELGAEGPAEILARTKRSIEVLAEYAKRFHKSHPKARLVIWVASHYDTISPLVKDAEGIGQADYVPVDYGGGVVINLSPSGEAVMETGQKKTALKIGRTALSA